MEPVTSELADSLKMADEAAYILRTQVVQGVSEEGGARYKLNIQKETELGDNESIRQASRDFIAAKALKTKYRQKIR